MGTFIGHVVPGAIYALFGLWWTTAQFYKYHRALKKNGTPYKNSSTHKMFCCKRELLSNLEIEGLLKVVGTPIHIIIEIVSSLTIGNLQHCLMLSFFFLNGVMDLLVHYKFTIPSKLKLNYITFAMAMSVQGFLFVFHHQDHPQLEVQGHKVVILLSFCTGVTTVVEMNYPKSLLIGLMKSLMIIMLGLWLATVGILLYPPGVSVYGIYIVNLEDFPPEWSDPKRIMMVPMIFALELMLVFTCMIVIGGIVGRFCVGTGGVPNETQYTKINAQLLECGSVNDVMEYHDECEDNH